MSRKEKKTIIDEDPFIIRDEDGKPIPIDLEPLQEFSNGIDIVYDSFWSNISLWDTSDNPTEDE